MTCIAAMKNMTAAMKGKNALEKAGFPCSIVNLEPTLTKRGCAYGVSFRCEDMDRVKNVLDRKNVDYGEILGGAYKK